MKPSLLRVFLAPFLALMLSLALTISWVMYRSGEEVTDAVAQETLAALSIRIQSEIERHLSSAHVILNAVAPESLHTQDKQFHLPLEMPRELEQIETRLWTATGLYPEINNLAYFAAEDGGFVSVKRLLADGLVEVRYRQAGQKRSDVYSMGGPQKKLALLRSDQFEPRQRPWYKNAIQQGKPAWSQVYIDFTRKEPLLTLSKPVTAQTADRVELVGVVATDLSLKQLSGFLQNLAMPRLSVAFVMEKSDELVATSQSEIPYVRLNDTTLKRQHASESASPSMRTAASYVRQKMAQHLVAGKPQFQLIDDGQQKLQIVATLLKADVGLDWISVVVVPRASISVTTSGVITSSLILGLCVILLMLAIGFVVLRWTIADIRKLAQAARSIGSGEPFKEIGIHRRDEIGVLAESLQEMEQHLRNDGLTQLLNRDAFIAQIDFRRRRASDQANLQFALLYIDLDYFKLINDTHGHEAGDKVLVEIAQRLRSLIRKDDTAARFGGDEFVVYLHGVPDAFAIKQLCDKLRMKLEAPIDLANGKRGYVGISFGLAMYPGDGLDIETLLRVADSRMFEDKKRRKAEADAH